MVATNGETLFLTLGIPVVFLLFFSAVHVLPTGTPHPVDFLVPGILALAVMATSMTALSIGTGFERGYGVLKRLGSTPLGRPRLLGAKILTVLAVEVRPGRRAGGRRVPARVGPGRPRRRRRPASARHSWPWCWAPWPSAGSAWCWRGPSSRWSTWPWSTPSSWCSCCSAACSSHWPSCPAWLADLSKVLPAAALSQALHGTLGHGTSVSAHDWVVLVVVGRGRPGGRRPHLPLGVRARAGQPPPARRWIQLSSWAAVERAVDVARPPCPTRRGRTSGVRRPDRRGRR